MAELNKPPLPPLAAPSSDDRRQWDRIFTALVETVQSQQSQIETLVDDRKFFEDSISLQRSRSALRIALLKSHISQMKKEDEMVRRVYASRLNLMVSSKERETLLYKKQLELAESDRDDFHVCVESLGAEMLELKEKLKCTLPDKGDTGIDGLKEKEQHIADLEKEIRRMKHEYKKLISKKDSDISALIAEKDFIWNQFKMKDDEFMSLLKTKQMDDEPASEMIKMQMEDRHASEMIKMQMEDRHANEIIKMLQCSLEMLQLTADEKDQTIANLAAGRAILESDVGRLTQESDQMKHRIEELQSLNKEKDARIASLQSELTRIETSLTRSTRGKSRFFENSGSHSGLRNVSGVLGECHLRKRPGRLSITNAEGSSIIKRRNVRQSSSGMQEAGTSLVLHGIRSPASLEIPRLFSSNFKVPKLKGEHRWPST